VLALAAEGAVERVLRIAAADPAHFKASTRYDSSQTLPPDKPIIGTTLLAAQNAELRFGLLSFDIAGQTGIKHDFTQATPLWNNEVAPAFCTQFLENIVDVYFHGSLA
jgi:hypothetical protein